MRYQLTYSKYIVCDTLFEIAEHFDKDIEKIISAVQKENLKKSRTPNFTESKAKQNNKTALF